jgi:hypothetical protein
MLSRKRRRGKGIARIVRVGITQKRVNGLTDIIRPKW